MGVVTMTEPIAHPDLGQPWTIEDLAKLPDDGMRYEIVDGSLLVSPMAGRRHVRAATLLRRLLDRQTPPDLTTVQEGGVNVQRRRSYFVPDLFVTRLDTFDKGDDDSFDQSEVLLAVEVLSPSNRGNDLVIKRHYYATGGIPHYWIVDPEKRTLTVLTLDGESYVERAVVEPGQVWESREPFPLRIDPGEFC
jgi:Uma2 family endonuclease